MPKLGKAFVCFAKISFRMICLKQIHKKGKNMLKKIGIMLAILVFTISAIEAEDLPKANVEVTAEFVSNYVFRGADILGSSLASQKGLKQDGKIQAWAFQPNITFLTPVEGLTFGIWGSFATRNRRDTDSDQVIQQGPGGSEVEFHPALDLISGIDATSINSTTGAVSMHTPECVDNSNCIPGFYKEQNGLSRSDEIDYSLCCSVLCNLIKRRAMRKKKSILDMPFRFYLS